MERKDKQGAQMEPDVLHPDHINMVTGRKYSEMNGNEKIKHIGKVVVFILTGGMVYPNIFSD